MEILNRVVIGNFTILEISGALLGLIVLISVVKSMLGRPVQGQNYNIERVCPGCRWEGEVSPWAKQCPSCGRPF